MKNRWVFFWQFHAVMWLLCLIVALLGVVTLPLNNEEKWVLFIALGIIAPPFAMLVNYFFDPHLK